MTVSFLEPPFPPICKDRTRSLLSHVIVDLNLNQSELKTGLYVHNAGEHLHLATKPPTTYRDFGPTEFTASAHYILAASLSSLLPGCEAALNYVDEVHGLSHAFGRACLDLRAQRVTKAIVAGALLAYPFESDLTANEEIAFAIALDSSIEAERLSSLFLKVADRRELRRDLLDMAGRVR